MSNRFQRPNIPYNDDAKPNNTRYQIITDMRQPITAQMLDSETNYAIDALNKLDDDIKNVVAGNIPESGHPENENKLLKTDGKGHLSWVKVGEEEIGHHTISSKHLQDHLINTDKIDTNAVVTDKIADKSITTNKLADQAVSEQKLAEEILTFNPFWRQSKNQIGKVTEGQLEGFTINTAIDLRFSVYKTIKTGVLWKDRDNEEKEILMAMGKKEAVHFYPSEFNVVKMTWSTPTEGKYWSFYQFIAYNNWVTFASYAKLISGNISGSYFGGITNEWRLCGEHTNLQSISYAHPHPYPETASGEVLFCMLANIVGKFPLNPNHPTFGYLPYLSYLTDGNEIAENFAMMSKEHHNTSLQLEEKIKRIEEIQSNAALKLLNQFHPIGSIFIGFIYVTPPMHGSDYVAWELLQEGYSIMTSNSENTGQQMGKERIDTGATELTTLTVGQIPPHSHGISVVGNYGMTAGQINLAAYAGISTKQTQETGHGEAHRHGLNILHYKLLFWRRVS